MYCEWIADVIKIQTQNDFYCFPSVNVMPLHYF